MSTVHLTLSKPKRLTPLRIAYRGFLLDREASRCTPKTMIHYTYTVGTFVAWLESRGTQSPTEIAANDIRAYLVGLQRRGLRDTTQHAHARGIKTWLNWLVNEGDLEVSPMRNVAMPRLEKRVPPPFAPEDVHRLLRACDTKTAKGLRDYAIVLALTDTGLRASEFVSLRVSSVDMRTGLITVIGKGRKQRTVRVGARARKSILRYLGTRPEVIPASSLWVAYGFDGTERGPLTLRGLQIVLRNLGKRAGVAPCSPHKFRRTFALWCLRDGMDLHSLRMLMGHADLSILQRYLALAGEDIERAHKAHSPVDNMLQV